MLRAKASKLASLPKRKAESIEPMDCAPVPKLMDGPGWVYEIKLDGYRAVAVKSDRGVSLFSRRRKSFDHHYPLIVEALAELPEGSVVDGEIVALDESGRPNFNLLQNFRSEASRIHYFIFDLLICNDRDLTKANLPGTDTSPCGSTSPYGVEITARGQVSLWHSAACLDECAAVRRMVQRVQ